MIIYKQAIRRHLFTMVFWSGGHLLLMWFQGKLTQSTNIPSEIIQWALTGWMFSVVEHYTLREMMDYKPFKNNWFSRYFYQPDHVSPDAKSTSMKDS